MNVVYAGETLTLEQAIETALKNSISMSAARLWGSR
jgi:hypothetical protein